MEGRTWARWTSLLGAAFAALAVLGLFVLGWDVPESDAAGADVIAFYEENSTLKLVKSFVVIGSALLLVLFAAHVRRVVRAVEREGDFAAPVFFAGAIILATALAMGEAIPGALAIDPQYLSPAAAEALNVLDQQFLFPTLLGFGTYLLGAGLAIVRFRILPAWLGWVALVLAAASFTPAGIFAAGLGLLWTLVASIVLYARSPVAAGVAARSDAG